MGFFNRPLFHTYCGCCREEDNEEVFKEGLLKVVVEDKDYDFNWHTADKEEEERRQRVIESNESKIVQSSHRKRQRQERIPLMTQQLSTMIHTTATTTKLHRHTSSITPPTPKTAEELELLRHALQMACEQDQFLFGAMSELDRHILIQCMEECHIPQGTVLFHNHDIGRNCYWLQSGRVERCGTKGCSVLQDGDWFGTMALLYDVPLQSSAKALTDLVVWKIHQPTFHWMVAEEKKKIEQQTMEDDVLQSLRKMKFFQQLLLRSSQQHQEEEEDTNKENNSNSKDAEEDDDNNNKDSSDVLSLMKELVHTSMERVTFRKGDVILQKGFQVPSNVCYLIEEGQVKVYDIGLGDSVHTSHILEQGDWFGFHALLTPQGPRVLSAMAASETVKALAMDRTSFETLVLNNDNGEMLELLRHERKLRFVQTLPIFATATPAITEDELQELVEAMEELCYPKGAYWEEVGKPRSQDLRIIQDGEVAVYDGFVTKDRTGDGNIFHLGDGDYFGDKHLLLDDPILSTDNVVCESNVTSWTLSRDDICRILNCNNHKALRKRLGASQNFCKTRRLRNSNHQNIQLKDLHKIDVLGEGGLGQVWLVRNKNTSSPNSKMYALKQIRKRKVLDQKQHRAVLREKELLSTMRHPFVLGLVNSFQDDDFLYMLSPLIQGGELYSLVVEAKGNGLTLAEGKFYMGCVLEALAYLHKRLICYRDLKLENIMIDKDGYCVLVDMGFAKVVTTKTFTLLGTPDYLVRCLQK